MPCESCAVQFSVFKRKRVCYECERLYCSGCLRRGGGTMCAPCRLLSTRPLSRTSITHLKVRDLQCFLQRQNVSTRGCVEKDELVSLCVSHVNGASYRRRGARSSGAGAFTSLKGITNNINDFITSAFDIRAPSSPSPPHQHTHHDRCNCFNASPGHIPQSRPAGRADDDPESDPHPRPERFTTRPGGERDIYVPVPEGGASPASSEGARRDTADCYEIEDLDDAGWEFVTRPADPLPNDSEVLMAVPESPRSSPPRGVPEPEPVSRATFAREEDAGMGGRAASSLDVRGGGAAAERGGEERRAVSAATTPRRVALEEIGAEEELERLSVRQLKELLVRGCVEYRGCVERAELLAHARRLWRARAAHADDLSAEESCKVCMAAPLECVLLECGHIATCTACARLLPECPICRRYVTRAVRFFRS